MYSGEQINQDRLHDGKWRRFPNLRNQTKGRGKPASLCRVVLLERTDANLIFLERSNSVNAGLRRAQCRHDRNLLSNGGVANGHFIFARNFSARTINDKTDVAV